MGATLCSHRVNLVSVMTFMAAAMLFVMMMVMARRHDPGNWTIFRIPTHRRIHRSGNRAARTFHKLLIADVLLERLSMRKAVYVLVNMIRYMSCMGRMNFRNYIFTRFFSLLYFFCRMHFCRQDFCCRWLLTNTRRVHRFFTVHRLRSSFFC